MAVSTMKKLAVFVPASETDRVLAKLVSLRSVSVEPTDTGEGVLALERLSCETERIEAEKRVARIEEALALLAKRSTRKKPLLAGLREVDRAAFRKDGSLEGTWSAVNDALATAERLRACTAEIQQTELLRKTLLPWISYELPLNVEETEQTRLLFGSLPLLASGEEPEASLAPFSAFAETVSEDRTARYLVITCLKSEEEDVLRALTEIGFLRLSFRGVDTTAEAAIESAIEKQLALTRESQELSRQLDVYAEQLDRMETLYDLENTALEIIKQKQKLASTETCSVLEGWVPEGRQKRVEKVLSAFDCAYEFSDPGPDDDPPILLRNNAFAENFEWVLGMYSYPKYGSFDPTFIMSIFYFLIFGLMFADVGYGLVVSLVCFLAVRFLKPKKGLARAMMMFGYCGISQMLMGVIFASYFGDFLSYFFGDALVITFDFLSGQGPIYFLVVSLGAGAVHLIAGMAVQLVQLCKRGRVWDGVFDIVSWWSVFLGLGLWLGLGWEIPGYVLLGVGLATIVLFAGRGTKNPVLRLGQGLLGIYNGVNYVSDLLSYSRIMALGLASAVIAKVVNQIAFMIGTTIPGMIAMVLVLIFGHLLNLVINLLGTFVHTARLQYIEFFGKFYEDGGTPFHAAAPSEKYTVDQPSVRGKSHEI